MPQPQQNDSNHRDAASSAAMDSQSAGGQSLKAAAATGERLEQRPRRSRIVLPALLLVVVAIILFASTYTYTSMLRSDRRSQAMEDYEAFRDEFVAIQTRLISIPNRIEPSDQVGQDALGLIDDLEDARSGSQRRLSWIDLPPQLQLEAEQQLSELQFLLAQARLFANRAEVCETDHSLESIERLNQLAIESYVDSRVPVAMLAQRSEILRLMKRTAEADRFERRAGLIPGSRSGYEDFLEGTRLYLGQDSPEACTHLEAATQADPDDVASWLVLGDCYRNLRRYREALECYERCLSIAPKSWIPQLNRGLVRLELEEFPQAEEDFREVITLNSEVHRARRGLAESLLAQDQAAAAKACLTDPGRPEHEFEVEDWALLYRIELELGQNEAAGKCLQRAQSLEPTTVQDFTTQAELLAVSNGDIESARKKLIIALELDPYAYTALLGLADFHSERQQSYETAIRFLDRLVERYPTDLEARIRRGLALARTEQSVDAMKDAQRALALDDSPQTHYDIARIYALANVQQESVVLSLALDHLRQAIVEPRFEERAARDPDLEALRDDERFQEIVKSETTDSKE